MQPPKATPKGAASADALPDPVLPAGMKGIDRLGQRLTARVPTGDVSACFVMEEIKKTTELPL